MYVAAAWNGEEAHTCGHHTCCERQLQVSWLLCPNCGQNKFLGADAHLSVLGHYDSDLGCQLNAPGKTDSQMKNGLHQISLWVCLCDIFLVVN